MEKPEDKLVLVVDDDPGIVGLFSETLRSEGFLVATARDGEEAIAQAQKLRPDMILLDLMLPGFGGLEVLEELRKGPLAKIPVAVISGHFTQKSSSEKIGKEASVVAYLDKPVKPSELINLLHKTLKTEGKKKGGR